MQGSEDATAGLHLCFFDLIEVLGDHCRAVCGALALLHTEDRPMAPGEDGCDRGAELLRVFGPGNDIGPALGIAKLRRRSEQVYLSGPQFFHKSSLQLSADS